MTAVLRPAALGVRRNVRRFGVSRGLGSRRGGSAHRAAACKAAARCPDQGVSRSRWFLLMGRAVPLNKPTAYSRLVGVPRGAKCHQGVRPARATRLYGRRKASVVSGRPPLRAGVRVVGRAALPRLRWPGLRPRYWGRPQVSSRGCTANWLFSAASGGSAYQLYDPSVHGFALPKTAALQLFCSPLSAVVLVE